MNGNYILIANPENRRAQYFQSALSRCGLPFAIVVSYEELLSGQIELGSVLQEDSLLRIESPGENFAVEKLLLQLGAQFSDQQSADYQTMCADEIDALENDLGLIRNPRQWYLGYREALSRWESTLAQHPEIRVMNWPSEITTMFDKIECHKLFAQSNIPIPASIGHVESYEDLLARMKEEQVSRVFIKIANGSSASGVVAFEVRGDFQRAITSVELKRVGGEIRFYNSLRVRTYVDQDDICDLINVLCRETVHVEEWFDKATIENARGAVEAFDLRVVVIGGEARHAVVRQSKSPMTNLHLGNSRGNLDQVKTKLGSHWDEVMATCEKVMTLFPRSLYAGVDVAIGAEFDSHVVLEVNAFGDLIPNVEHKGNDTYESEIRTHLS